MPVRRVRLREPVASVWAGPESGEDNGGITFSLLSRFLVCRERFRLLVVEGLKPQERFNARIEYGNMWHVCEEAIASEVSHFGEVVGTTLWGDSLLAYCQELVKKYPHDRAEIDRWYEVCKVQFPLYVRHWAKSRSSKGRKPLMSEEKFRVPYRLPSGKVVHLRGKWDSVDLVGKGVWLQENKTKSRIDPVLIQRQLTNDLQTMIYAVAFTTWQDLDGIGEPVRFPPASDHRLVGVRYNVVRRTEHRQTKKESVREFATRVGSIIEEAPQDWFMRWEVTVTPGDVENFKRKTLNPILEQLCMWWKVVTLPVYNIWDAPLNNLHWQSPYGCYNPLLEGTPGDLDDYIDTGRDAGLDRVTDLFPELQ